MDEESAVQIEGLEVQYGHQIVLPKLDLVIPKGQIIGLLGPSGCGKTTLVKSIIGINKYKSGSIYVFGKQIPSFDAMSAIGYMSQNDALYDDLSAIDNLLFFGKIYGIHGKAANIRAKELLDFVDLSNDSKKAVRYYSGGMRRRLSLAIALINRPNLLILDEPTVGIDPVLRRKFWDEFELLKSEGCTILATTHVMDEASRCDRIILLREGKIIANGTPGELLIETNTNNIEDAFLYFSGENKKEMD